MLLSAGGFAVYRTESNAFSLEPKFGNLSVRKNKEKLSEAWLKSKLFWRSGLEREPIRTKILAECRNGGDFLRIVMGEIARNQGVERWADCTPDHLLYLRRIKLTLPEALVIHIIRDGRDVAQSLERQSCIHPFPWDKNKGLLVAGLFWEWMVMKGRSHGRALGADYHEVHFEDLIIHPRATLAAIGNFLDHDLDYDHIVRVGIGAVREPNTSFAKESQHSGFNPIGRWKRLFDDKELAQFEGLVGQSLKSFGYPLLTTNGQPWNTILELKTKRALYRSFFDSKMWLKTQTPLGRLMGNTDLSHL